MMNKREISFVLAGLAVGIVATIFTYNYSRINSRIAVEEQSAEASVGKFQVALNAAVLPASISLGESNQTVMSLVLASSSRRNADLQFMILNLKGIKDLTAIKDITVWDQSSGSKIGSFDVNPNSPYQLTGLGMYVPLTGFVAAGEIKNIDIKVNFSPDYNISKYREYNPGLSFRTELLSVLGYTRNRNRGPVFASGVPLITEQQVKP